MKQLGTLLLLAFSPLLLAQDYDDEQLAEIERQKQFRAGFEAIINDLNEGSTLGFSRAIDPDDMLQRIMGLRLIDRRIQKGFADDFDQTVPKIVESTFASSKDGVKAHVLDFASRGTQGRALVRYDLPKLQFNYHEYELRFDDERNRVYILDWVDFINAQQFTESIGEGLVAAKPSKPALRKLAENNLTDSQLFQLGELLKAARDRRVDRFLQVFEGMNERVKSEKVVVRAHAQFMWQMRQRRYLRSALIEMDKYYPEEPLFSLMLLDYYFPNRKFDEALGALLRLEQRLGVDDSAMKARLSAASLVAGQPEEAVVYADRAVDMEPGLELGWWSVLRANANGGNHARSVEALTALEDNFGHTLNVDALARDRSFGPLLASSEYREWSAARH